MAAKVTEKLPRGIQHYKDSSGQRGFRVWVARNIDGQTVRKSRVVWGTLPAARKIRDRLRADLLKIESGEKPKPKSKKYTVEDMLDHWETWATKNKHSASDDVSRGKRVREALGSRSAESVIQEDVEDLMADLLEDGLKPATANRYRSLISAAFNHALRNRRVHIPNPCTFVRKLAENNLRQREVTDDEVLALIADAPPHLARIILWARLTGRRRGEVLSLERGHLDLKSSPPLILPPALWPGNFQGDPWKTAHNKRQGLIPLADILVKDAKKVRSGSLFTWRGERVRKLRRSWPSLLARNGLQGIWFHDLRRSFKNHLARLGIRESLIDMMTGHQALPDNVASLVRGEPTVRQRYAAVSSEDLKEVAELINECTFIAHAKTALEKAV